MNFNTKRTHNWQFQSRLISLERDHSQITSVVIRRPKLRAVKWPSNITITIMLGCFTLFTLSSGCKKFVQIQDAPNKLPTAAVFADSADATDAVLGNYITLMGISSVPFFINGQVTILTGLSSDELYPSTNNADYLQFYSNAISPSTSSNNPLLWGKAYYYIYHANACIEGIIASNSLSPSVKNELLGESKLFRGLSYFYLVNIYGPVPLVTTTSYQSTENLPRASVDTVYQQIVSDLLDAENLLSVNYPSSGRVRPNQYTASALLARTYLYMRRWSDAEVEASKVINSGIYTLVPDPNQIFLAGSNEAIWQLPPLQQGYETAEGCALLPRFGYGNYHNVIPTLSLNPLLLGAFEAGDNRRLAWVDSNIISGKTYYYAYKYKLGLDRNSTPVENLMLARLGEQYLIRAEAEAQQGEATAVSDLNTIRTRANLSNYSGGIDQASVLAAIYQERRIELFCEMGNRWFDLKRTGAVDTVMANVTPSKGGTWSENWELYPISVPQIQANPFLTQNPGYAE